MKSTTTAQDGFIKHMCNLMKNAGHLNIECNAEGVEKKQEVSYPY